MALSSHLLNRKFLVVLAIAATSGVVVDVSAANVGDLDRITQERLLLQAQVDREKARIELAEQQRRGLGQPVPEEVVTLPVVRYVSGSGGVWTAMLAIPGSGVAQVRTGDTLPNGLKVKSISALQVTLTKGTKSYDVKIGGEEPKPIPPTAGN